MTEKTGPGQADKKAAEQKTEQVAAQNAADGASTAAEKVEATTDGGAGAVLDSFPDYEDKPLAELRRLASSRGVEINRDVEKAYLVVKLRVKDPAAAYDVMPLEQLRETAKKAEVGLDEDFERAHLVTELRAADTHTG